MRLLSQRHTEEELARFMGRDPHIYLPDEQLPVRTSGRRMEHVFPIEHKVYFYAMPSSARFFVYINKDGTSDRFLCYYDWEVESESASRQMQLDWRIAYCFLVSQCSRFTFDLGGLLRSVVLSVGQDVWGSGIRSAIWRDQEDTGFWTWVRSDRKGCRVYTSWRGFLDSSVGAVLSSVIQGLWLFSTFSARSVRIFNQNEESLVSSYGWSGNIP